MNQKSLNPVFQPINSKTWERKSYFDYYYYSIKSKYNLNVNIDISILLEEIKKNNLKFYPTFLYVIMQAVNQNKEFRMSFDLNGTLGYWNYVLPSYTIFHEDDKTFSDIWSEYAETFSVFYETVKTDMQTYKNVKKIKDRPDRPANFCPISVLPWLSFTSLSQDSYSESSLLFPIIRFGKYLKEANKTLIPLAVFVNHAVADGYHTCKLINDMQNFANTAKEWVK